MHDTCYILVSDSDFFQEYGFFVVFHRVPTGLSVGALPPYHGERTVLGTFSGNRAHSNQKVRSAGEIEVTGVSCLSCFLVVDCTNCVAMIIADRLAF